MAFSLSGLQRIGAQNANSPTLWTYKSADALATVDGSGYFNGAADRLKVDDWILVAVTGTAWGIMIVNGNTRDLAANPPVQGVVDCTNALSAGTVDSD